MRKKFKILYPKDLSDVLYKYDVVWKGEEE